MNPHPDTITVTEPANPVAKSGLRWKWLIYLGVVVALIIAGKYFHAQNLLKQALDWVGQLGSWGAIIFVAIYVVAAVLFVPGSVLTLGAGALFGVVRGSIYVSIGSTLGATSAFLVGRYLARDAIARKIEGSARFAAIDKAVANEGWKIVGLTRLSPVFPFTLLNYSFGLTRVKLRDYVLASWIGMMPGTVMYVYLGSLARAGTAPQQRTTGEWVLYGVGLLATVVVTIFVTRIAKKALAQRITQ
ncbi:MAG: TVP38/TMEM64 family protein [Verrucomicrobiota bacterium]|nr:TVP38/TMEM64 family protein [Verrucomicrobiota bacterium]